MLNSLSSFKSLFEIHASQLVKSFSQNFPSSLSNEADISMRMNLMGFASLWFLNLIDSFPIWTSKLLAKKNTYNDFFEIFNE
jgi:hypothetical protein